MSTPLVCTTRRSSAAAHATFSPWRRAAVAHGGSSRTISSVELSSSTIPSVELRDGARLPAVGLGTSFFLEEGMDLRDSREGDATWESEMCRLTKEAIETALAAGVRLFE